jgi:hypothetical protein
MLSSIVENMKTTTTSVSTSDPFDELLRGPMPAIYKTSDSIQYIEEQFLSNIDSYLKEYRIKRGDHIDRTYTDEENANDKDTIYYIHTQWCSRLASIQSGLQSHKRLIASSPESTDSMIDSNKRLKDNESIISDPVDNMIYRHLFSPDTSNSVTHAPPSHHQHDATFMTASELHRLMNSEHPDDKERANKFFSSPLPLSQPSGHEDTPVTPTMSQSMVPPPSPTQTSAVLPFSTIKTINLPHVPTPSITTWTGKAVNDLTAWYGKLHHHSHTLQQQWEILSSAIPHTQLLIAENTIRTHIHHKFRTTTGLYLDINLDVSPFGQWPIPTFLRLLNDIYGYKSKLTYNYEHTLSTNLCELEAQLYLGIFMQLLILRRNS